MPCHDEFRHMDRDLDSRAERHHRVVEQIVEDFIEASKKAISKGAEAADLAMLIGILTGRYTKERAAYEEAKTGIMDKHGYPAEWRDDEDDDEKPF